MLGSLGTGSGDLGQRHFGDHCLAYHGHPLAPQIRIHPVEFSFHPTAPKGVTPLQHQLNVLNLFSSKVPNQNNLNQVQMNHP